MNTPDPFMFAKTLFYSVGNTSAALVTNTRGRRRRKVLRFTDAHLALTWCLENRVAFVCLPVAPGIEQN